MKGEAVRKVAAALTGLAVVAVSFVVAGRIYGSEPTDDLNFLLAGAATVVMALGVAVGTCVGRRIRRRR